MVFRHADDDFLLTAARPALGWFEEPRRPAAGRARGRHRRLRDARRPGAASRTVLAALAPEVEGLGYFDHRPAKLGERRGHAVPHRLHRRPRATSSPCPPTTRSPCWTPSSRPGRDHTIRPFGEEALMTLRIEAGLPLVDVEWHDSRLAFTDADRVTPKELGFGWMLSGVRDGSRRFVGSEAIRRELRRRHLPLGDDGHRRRLGRLGPAAPRRRAAPAQERAPAAVRVDPEDDDGDEVGYCTSSSTPRAAAPHRHRPGASRPG